LGVVSLLFSDVDATKVQQPLAMKKSYLSISYTGNGKRSSMGNYFGGIFRLIEKIPLYSPFLSQF
jgi:hypothetical protein